MEPEDGGVMPSGGGNQGDIDGDGLDDFIPGLPGPDPELGFWANSLTRPDLPISYNYNNITFLRYDEQGYTGKDNLKVALGKSWTEKPASPGSTHMILSNDDKPLDLFYGCPLVYEKCGTTGPDGAFPGFLPASADPPDGVPPYLKDTVYIEKIYLAVDEDSHNGLPYYTPEQRALGLHEGKIPLFDEWAGFMKVGIVDQTGKTYRPIINRSGKTYHGVFQNEVFNDHVYKSVDPFTEKELLSKQPFGKAAQISLSTYYNTGYDSTEWEQFVSNLGTDQFWQGSSPWKASGYDVAHMHYNNITPTPYALFRLMSNKFEVSDLYDEQKMILGNHWNATSFAIGDSNSENRISFVKYPYELCMTMNGRIPSGSIAKLANVKPKEQDVQDQFADYLQKYMQQFSRDANKDGLADDGSSMKEHRIAMELLDQVFNNVAISPSSLKSIDKVQQLKKYFPFYAEMGFSMTQNTELGDMIKKILFGKYFVNKIAGYNTYTNALQAFAEDSEVAPPLGNPKMLNFADYRQEKIYEDDGDEFEAPKLALNKGGTKYVNKKYYPIVEDLYEYIHNPEVYGIPTGIDSSDVQNHIAYLRDDVAEPVDANEYNNIWKIVLGTAMQQKLIKVYKEHHRKYEDLLSGKPAYSEDIAYKIEKWAKKPDDPEEFWTISQNIIIPNTSDVNIFNYVDTQIKYGYDMMYKYKIYAVKIVFGCSYDYTWGDLVAEDYFTATDAWVPHIGTPVQELKWLGGEYHLEDDMEGGFKKLTAEPGVRIFPNIAMLEDLFYESPPVYISDHPPIPPDANIIPYRGKSDKILILLNGMVDTYRAEPIIMMDSDIAMFDFIKNAQLSVDGKVKFSEDSPAKSGALKFQIFRTKNKPMSYTDFELYDTIAETFLKDAVSPNQKYYYTFRAIDVHGHISNPTEVYEVELIDDHGSVKPMIRIFNFEEPKYFDAVKECQKYLMIKPNLKQLYYNSEKDSIDHMFNDSDTSGVRRRFKVRITSKSTGKKIDLNIDFSKNEVNNGS